MSILVGSPMFLQDQDNALVYFIPSPTLSNQKYSQIESTFDKHAKLLNHSHFLPSCTHKDTPFARIHKQGLEIYDNHSLTHTHQQTNLCVSICIPLSVESDQAHTLSLTHPPGFRGFGCCCCSPPWIRALASILLVNIATNRIMQTLHQTLS